ncbi:unnamed protein product [Sphagnum balticum]
MLASLLSPRVAGVSFSGLYECCAARLFKQRTKYSRRQWFRRSRSRRRRRRVPSVYAHVSDAVANCLSVHISSNTACTHAFVRPCRQHADARSSHGVVDYSTVRSERRTVRTRIPSSACEQYECAGVDYA